MKDLFPFFTTRYIACNGCGKSNDQNNEFLLSEENHIIEVQKESIIDCAGLYNTFKSEYIDLIECFYTEEKKKTSLKMTIKNIFNFYSIVNFLKMFFYKIYL